MYAIRSYYGVADRVQIGDRALVQTNAVIGSDGFGFIPVGAAAGGAGEGALQEEEGGEAEGGAEEVGGGGEPGDGFDVDRMKGEEEPGQEAGIGALV